MPDFIIKIIQEKHEKKKRNIAVLPNILGLRLIRVFKNTIHGAKVASARKTKQTLITSRIFKNAQKKRGPG